MNDNLVQEAQISKARAFLYRLLRSFFIEQSERLPFDFWKESLRSLSTEPVNMDFDSAVSEMLSCLGGRLDEIEKEHYRLFVDPFSDDLIPLTVSAYLEGRNYSQTLVRVRQCLQDAALEAQQDAGVPEDYIPLLFEAMELLIQEDAETLNAQKEICSQFLFPVIPLFSEKLKTRGRVFYPAVARFLEAFFRLEEDYL
jgi:TorA maturation chaperone TorD